MSIRHDYAGSTPNKMMRRELERGALFKDATVINKIPVYDDLLLASAFTGSRRSWQVLAAGRRFFFGLSLAECLFTRVGSHVHC